MTKRLIFPIDNGASDIRGSHDADSEDARPNAATAPPRSIHDLPRLGSDWREVLFRVLIPSDLLVGFDIHPVTLTNSEGTRLATYRFDETGMAFQLQVRNSPDAVDPLYMLQLQDTSLDQIVVAFMATNDPNSPRFNVDRDDAGQPTLMGTARRNVTEEVRAMNAGLAPGQVRKGLRLLDAVMERVEAFVVLLGHDSVLVEPLAYHNAVMFERHGFCYVQGQREMEWIHSAFSQGGELTERLDDTSPFRRPAAAQSVRGRSWAIHDGVLGRPWDGVRMIKRLGPRPTVDSAPQVPW